MQQPEQPLTLIHWWLWREGKDEESPPETKLAVKAVSLIGPVWHSRTYWEVTLSCRVSERWLFINVLSTVPVHQSALFCCSLSSEALGHHRTVAVPVHTKGRWSVSAPRRDPREGQWSWRSRRQTHQLSEITLREFVKFGSHESALDSKSPSLMLDRKSVV